MIDGEPTLTTEGSVGAFPSKIPMIDVVTVGAGGGSIAWLSPEGTLKVGPQSAGADPGPLCYGKGGTEVTITDAHVFLGRIPPHLLGGEIPLDVEAARAGIEALAARARHDARGLRDRRPRDLRLEPGQRAAPGHRQARPRRPRLHADHLRRLRLAAAVPARSTCSACPTVLVPPNPGNVSAFGLLTVDVKNDYVQTHVTLADQLDPAAVAGIFDGLTAQAAEALTKEGFDPAEHQFVRTADLRYFGQAFEVRVPVAAGDARPGRGRRRVPRRAHARSTATTSPATPPSRSSGSTSASPASARSSARRSEGRVGGFDGWRGRSIATRPSKPDRRGRSASTPPRGTSSRRCSGDPTCHPGTVVTGPAIIEEFGSTVPLHPGFTARVDEYLNIIVTRSAG